MQFSDIEAAIEGRHHADIEEAFKALVQPGYADIEGATEHQLEALLPKVCQALIGNSRQMPSDIAERVSEDYERPKGGTYGDAARVVLAAI